jgi:predicted secreted protein
MRWTSILAIYALFWVMSFFLVLPFRLQGKGEDRRVPGQAESAPPLFSFARTARWATIVGALLFGLFYANYVEGWVPVQALNLVPDRVLDGR